jgi:hypothetical protein
MAQEVNVEISELRCNTNPELVVVTNKGDTPIDMTGWNLQSDPTSRESLALQQFGSLAAGETLTAQAGPGAEGAFVWSRTEVFRDNDSSDFAQLASDAGQVLLKVNCAGAAQQSATATPAATPSPTALGAVSAPTAGGPPGVASSISPIVLFALGSGFSSAGLGALVLSFRGSRSSAPVLAALPEPQPMAVAPGSRAESDTRSRRVRAQRSAGLLPIVAIALLLAAIFLALQSGERKQK